MTHDPILVVGITQRSGTNYLTRLLDLHPDVARPRRILEDYLPVGAGRIAEGVRMISARYMDDWIPPHDAEAMLRERVGDALLDWLAEDAGLTPDDPRRLLTKTPGAYRLRDLATLVPGASLLVLVRDGRDVVASGMRGLGWSFTKGVDRWLEGAREVLSLFGRPLPLGVRARLVRYEDVVADPVGSMHDLQEWLGLDPERWDVDAARSLPVYGSSYVTGGAEEVHWDPVERPEGFDPRGRAAGWSDELHTRFLFRAAVELRALGYEVERPEPSAAAARGVARELVRVAKRGARFVVSGD